MANEVHVVSCIPVIPSSDLERSLRFWVEGLGLAVDRAMHQDGRLVGCMVRGGSLVFWLNRRAGSPLARDDFEGIASTGRRATFTHRALVWNGSATPSPAWKCATTASRSSS